MKTPFFKGDQPRLKCIEGAVVSKVITGTLRPHVRHGDRKVFAQGIGVGVSAFFFITASL